MSLGNWGKLFFFILHSTLSIVLNVSCQGFQPSEPKVRRGVDSQLSDVVGKVGE